MRRLLAILIALGLPGCVTTGPDATVAFVAQSRTQARDLEAKGALADARLHWRYVATLAPADAEAAAEIARLTRTIADRRDALVRQGEAALKAGRTTQARTFYLKALALDGSDARARGGLAEMDVRAMLANQDKKDQKDQKAMSEYVAQVHKNEAPPATAPAGSPGTLPATEAAVPADLGPPAYNVLRR
jgi:hypothetical protein